ncbi:hypothetical protein [Spirillospora albida]|uniref:hypothetical protein n=1 Tax=Spirillospora albida TaxID=58123 RepID=UPI00068F3FF6|nr:hypothetical protein [Spirillospora albida]
MATKTARSSGSRPKSTQSSRNAKTQGATKTQGTAKTRVTKTQGTAKPRAKTQPTSKSRATAKPQGTPKPRAARPARTGAPGTVGGRQGRESENLTVTIPRTVITAASTPFAVAGRVLPAKKGLPVYMGLGALAAGGAIAWPVAAGIGVAYASMRRWGRASGPAGRAPGNEDTR